MRLQDLDRLVNADRVRNYSLLLVVGYAIAVVAWLVYMAGNDWLDPFGSPLGYDFITFYAASDLARMGDPAGAFDYYKIYAREVAAVPSNTSIFLWHYPPPFNLVIAPLAFFPYPVALAGWLAVTLGLYLLLVRRISDHRYALLIALAFPATFINLMHGQNGFLNAALLGGGLLLLDKRPWLAGVLIGLMVYKPHFGVLLPLLLAVQGRWKTFASASVTALAVCAIAYVAYGPEPWLAFFANFDRVSIILERGHLPWSKIPSVFVMFASLGAPMKAAYAAHAAVAVGLALATLIAWRGPGPQSLKVALAIPAILAVSPYCFDYDLVLLALPIGLLADYGRTSPLAPGARIAMAAAFLGPVVFPTLAYQTHVQLMPVTNLLLYVVVWRTLAVARRGDVAVAPAVVSPSLAG